MDTTQNSMEAVRDRIRATLAEWEKQNLTTYEMAREYVDLLMDFEFVTRLNTEAVMRFEKVASYFPDADRFKDIFIRGLVYDEVSDVKEVERAKKFLDVLKALEDDKEKIIPKSHEELMSDDAELQYLSEMESED